MSASNLLGGGPGGVPRWIALVLIGVLSAILAPTPTRAETVGTGFQTTTYAYNADSQLCWSKSGTSSNTCASPPSGATTYTFNKAGDEKTNSNGSWTYTFDQEDRLITAVTGSTTKSYTYDGDGLRLTNVGSNTTNYTWDVNGGLPLLAREVNGSTTRDYTYGNGLVSEITGGSSYWYLTDAQGSVANLTSSTGVAEWTYTYDPYGNARSTTQNDPNAPTNLLRYTGQLTDPSTGLYQLRARMYDPSLGRFMTLDPYHPGPAAPYGNYLYAGDAPTVLSDPSGLWPCLGDFCLSDAIHGAANFLAGAGNFVTSTVTFGHVHIGQTYCGPGLGWSYSIGGWTAGIEALLVGGAGSAAESGAAADTAATEADGGVYSLRNEAGSVVRTGRSSDLAAREAAHFNDPVLW